MSHSTSQLYHEFYIDTNKEKVKSLGTAINTNCIHGSGLGAKASGNVSECHSCSSANTSWGKGEMQSKTGIIGKLSKRQQPFGKGHFYNDYSFCPFRTILFGVYTIKKAALILEHLPAL